MLWLGILAGHAPQGLMDPPLGLQHAAYVKLEATASWHKPLLGRHAKLELISPARGQLHVKVAKQAHSQHPPRQSHVQCVMLEHTSQRLDLPSASLAALLSSAVEEITSVLSVG